MTDKKNQANSGPVGRRDFLRQVLLAGLERVERVGEALERKVGALDAVAPNAIDPARLAEQGYLRPPGAIDQPDFGQTCSRCGDCVRACPAQCILLSPDAAGGMPFIVPSHSPCVVCEDLSCMKACPTGALRLVEDAAQINMGMATVQHDRCLRSGAGQTADNRAGDEDCRLCVTDCPLGEQAIAIEAQGRVEILPGCIGCGVCERVCPTQPASVRVVPKAAL